MLAEEPAQIGRHPGIDREMDDMAAPPPLQRGLEQADEVFRLLLDLDLAVAQHAEDPCATTVKPGNSRSRNSAIIFSTGRKRIRVPGSRTNRSTEEGIRISACNRSPSLTRSSCKRETEAAICDERKRMRRIERQRRQYREQIGHETLFEPGPVARFEIGRLDNGDAGLGELGAQRHPGHLLRFHQRAGALVDRFELLPRGQPVLAQRLDAGEALTL